MDSIERSQLVQQAKRRLRARRQRAGELRGRVVAVSLIGFLLLWAVVFVQMATGNDPVLGGSATSAVDPQRASAVDPQRDKPHAAKSNIKAVAVEADPDSDDGDSQDTDSDDGDRPASAAAGEGSGPEERQAQATEPEPAAEELAPVTTGQS